MDNLISDYFNKFTSVDNFSLQANQMYFEALYKSFQDNAGKDIKIHEPENEIHSEVIPFAILDPAKLPVIQDYADLSEVSPKLKDYQLNIIKMHAGLGTSVKREEYLKEIKGREKLGSKGTDLFIAIDGKNISIADLQLKQIEILNDSRTFKKVTLQNLVNEETAEEVNKLQSPLIKENILQLKVPTIDDGEISTERLAPAGHAFLGFSLLLDLFQKDDIQDEIVVIGNGEDLNSTPDAKVFSWMVEKNIPICMITTTKLEKDKKGGQISKVVGSVYEYVTIIEKAQAEKAGQLEYFSELGLRPSDHRSLFNTNIVVINKKVLKQRLKSLDVDKSKFCEIITPDLIKNIKPQDGKQFIQLEGAIGSTILNLDKFFRLQTGEEVVAFLNLDPLARESFFIPLKTMDDFEDLKKRYVYDKATGRFQLKGAN